MTELQNIALVYESMLDNKGPRFTPDFTELPDKMPLGFWIDQEGAFCAIDTKFETHEAIIAALASNMANGKALVNYYKSYYLFAYTILKLVRVATEQIRGKNILFYQFPDKSKISRRAMTTINDIAMMYDCTVEYDGHEDPE